MSLTLSIVIPVKNGARYLNDWRRALEVQRGAPAFEVIAVDSGSTDSTVYMLERLGVKVLKVPEREFGHGKTRNLAASAASGDLVLFMVQDALPMGPGFLSAMTSPFYENSELAGVRARQVPPPGVPVWAAWLASRTPAASTERRVYRLAPGERLSDLPRDKAIQMCGLDFVASCIRRDVWQQAALPEVRFGEDMAWTAGILEMGWSWMHEPDAVVAHAHARSFTYAFMRAYLEERAILELLGGEAAGTGSGIEKLWNTAATTGPLLGIPPSLASLAKDVKWFAQRSRGLTGAMMDMKAAAMQVMSRGVGAALGRFEHLRGTQKRFEGRV